MTTFLIGDYFFVSKYAYGYSRCTWPFSSSQSSGRIWGSEPARGDVVAFLLPKDHTIVYIKRVVGLPGDRIQMKQGLLHINGVPVARERLPDFMNEDPCGWGAPTRTRRLPVMAYYVYILASKKHGTLYLGVTNSVLWLWIPGPRFARPGMTGERVWASKNPGIAAGVLHFVDR